MRILITGSSGLIGSQISNKLSEFHEIIKFGADLTSYEATADFLDKCGRVDFVLHCAALVPISNVEKNKSYAYRLNVFGTGNLLLCLQEAYNGEMPKIFYLSTGHVYASCNNDLITEDSPIGPRNFYAMTKYLGEQQVLNFSKYGKLDFAIARIFSVFSEKQSQEFLYGNLREKLFNNPAHMVDLYGYKNIRNFLHVDKLVNILQLLIDSDFSGFVNVASDENITVEEFARQQFGEDINLNLIGSEVPDHIAVDNSLLRRLLRGHV